MLPASSVRLALALTMVALLSAQVPLVRPTPQEPARPPAAAPPRAPQQQPAPAPAAPTPAQPTPAAQTQPAAPAPLADTGAFMVPAASLTEMIDILARRLKINIIIDPRVKGTVTIYTYGEVRPVDYMQLLQTILRINGATMVKVGDLYRIIPINLVSQMPLDPITNADPKTLPEDDRMILNLVFLKYATATEIDKLITPFLGEGAAHSVYEPANLIILQDNGRNMRRTMELVGLFDSDTFAGQRVRLFDVNHTRPTDLVKDLDSVFKAYARADKAPVQFLPIDRINTIVAVAPNPGIFDEVDNWVKKLDVPVRIPAGAVNNYVYRLKYGKAATVAMAIMALYTGNAQALMSMSAMANASMVASGMGYGGAVGGGGYGGAPGYGGMGYGGIPGGGAYPGGMIGGVYGPGYYNNPAGYNYGGGFDYGQGYGAPGPGPALPTQPGAAPNAGAPTGQNLTGSFLGNAPQGASQAQRLPHVIPNPFGNTLLIQATPQEYEQILNLLQQLDLPPRQVLIDAKIYEVDLTADLAGGVESWLQKVGSPISGAPGSRTLTAVAGAQALGSAGAGLGLTTGLLVLKSHELLAALTASDSRLRGRVISSPSIIATDSIPATINVGSQVPTLSSVASTGVQQGGSSVFANNITNVGTGTTLSIVASVNSSGVVTMIINQQVSAPIPPLAGAAIQSPSFSNRSLSTQMTVQDGDTVAIGGIIQENHTESTGGVPFLNRVPVLGAAFGAKNVHTDRTELIIFLTPRVIYDTNQIVDATEEIKSNLKRVGKLMNDR